MRLSGVTVEMAPLPRPSTKSALPIFDAAALLYVQTALLMLMTFTLGRAGVGAVRYIFIIGCVAIGYQAWRAGPKRHLEMSIILFVCAPFLRRVVDFSAGFDASGTMLIGPVLCLAPPCIDLYHWLVTGRLRRNMRMLGPYVLMSLCLLYGFAVSITDGALLPATIQLTKFLPPLLYGLWLSARGGENPDVMDGAVRGFLITMPAAGIYGVYQYFYPPEWDTYWLNMSGAISMGVGESQKIRVFGPMNSPASLGHFMLAAILVIGFALRGWLYLPLCVPIFAGLMLSSVRTAWIALVVGVAFCALHNSTRRRAMLLALSGAAIVGLILVTTSFGEAVIDRFSSLTAPTQDGSAQVRENDFVELMDHVDQLVVGLGLAGPGASGEYGLRVNIPLEAMDGIILTSIFQMGLVFGGLYMLGILWAVAQGLLAVQRTPSRPVIAACAVVLGNVVALPITAVSIGEMGFLFWSFIGIISAVHAPLGASPSQIARPLLSRVAS